MSDAITLIEAQEQLAAWMEASKFVAKGLQYSIGNRTLRREDSEQIRENINYWLGMVNKLKSGLSLIHI